MAMENKVLKVLIAVLLPPLAVYLDSGASTQFLLNLVLTVVGFWVVGVIHALLIVL